MKKLFFLFSLAFACYSAPAQKNAEAETLVREGIDLHDKGDYEGALRKYDAAIKLDNSSFDAWYEKGYTLYAMDRKKEVVSLSKDMVKQFKGHPGMNQVFMQYGSALDDIGKSKDALDIYDEGIALFPEDYLLYFNKGLTMLKLNRVDEGRLLFEKALSIRPLHSSSNYYLGLILQDNNKIPAIMAFATFLGVEPQTSRSKDGWQRVQKLIGGNVKTEGNNTTITLDPSMLSDKKVTTENDFRTVEVMFTLTTALDNNKSVDSVFTTAADKLSLKLQMMINSMSTQKEKAKGFYWSHYVPFFEALKEDAQIGTLVHLMMMQAKDEDNKKWLEDHEEEVNKFYDWLKAYKWN